MKKGSPIASWFTALSSILLLSDCTGGRDGQADAEVPAEKVENFSADQFDRSAQIDNPWLPLKPGTRYVYEGNTVEDDGTVVPHRFEVHVTDLTKVIGGVRALVTYDLDYSDGELVEAELAFYAQDREGTVWYMGEYPEEYEDGKFLLAPAWIHGFEDAKAGIMMRAKPELGTPSYAEGWGPAVDWTDRGQVDQVGQHTCVPVGCYDDVLVIAESSQQEQDAAQLKYYANGVGNIRVGWRGAGEKTKETLELTKVEHLDAAALAAVREKAMALERDAFRRKNVAYAQTSPLERAPATTTSE